MARSEAVISRQDKRAERQTQILNAARACVRAEGFHAASMSRIAAQASMSGGHIYLYFETKESIMFALCERDFEDFILRLSQIGKRTGGDADAIVKTFPGEFVRLLDHDRAALTLEVMAEAGRNQRFSELVMRVDHRIRDAIRNIIEPALVGLSKTETDARVETVLMMMRGIAVHTGSRRVTDAKALIGAFEISLRGVLSSASSNPTLKTKTRSHL